MSRRLVAARTLFPVLLGITAGAALLTASRQDAPTAASETFEAVSIKPSRATASGSFMFLPGGRVVMEDGFIVTLLARAYDVKPFQIVDLPDWANRQRFTVRTSAAGSPDAARLQGMLRQMFAQRFRLQAHREQRITPVHVLTLSRSDGRLGPNLKPRTPPCERGVRIALADLSPDVARGLPDGLTSVPCGSPLTVSGFSMKGIGMTMPALAQVISDFWLNEQVIDRTGLTGSFDITIDNMVNQWTSRGPSTDAAVSDAAPLPAALQEQLGLRIEARREPLEVLVIDRLEPPSED
jgi:uncharacterized protein (TIGR03435 family)